MRLLTHPFASAHTAPMFVEITILDRRCLVRADRTLTGTLDDEGYIESDSPSCANGTCRSCLISLMPPNTLTPVWIKACTVFPTEGLAIVELGGEFRLPLRRAS